MFEFVKVVRWAAPGAIFTVLAAGWANYSRTVINLSLAPQDSLDP